MPNAVENPFVFRRPASPSAGGFAAFPVFSTPVLPSRKSRFQRPRRNSPTFPEEIPAHSGCTHPIHPVNLSRGQGESIQEVSGSGNFPASETVGHPPGNAIQHTFPAAGDPTKRPRVSQLGRCSHLTASNAPTERISSRPTANGKRFSCSPPQSPTNPGDYAQRPTKPAVPADRLDLPADHDLVCRCVLERLEGCYSRRSIASRLLFQRGHSISTINA